MATTRSFGLHPRLAADCTTVGDLPVSRVLLMNDRRFPWCVLVPRLPDLTELHHLPRDRRMECLDEVERVSMLFLDTFGARKINVGALGNVVPQLHVHVVGRTPGDAAWPGPVWGSGAAEPYHEPELRERVAQLRAGLAL